MTLTDNENLSLTVAVGSAAISMVSLAVAMLQLRAGVRQARHQATFEHLGRVRGLLGRVSGIDPVQARQGALNFYAHRLEKMPEHAQLYLELLTEWDLLGVAFQEKQVDRKIVLRSLRHTLRSSHNVSRDFINELKEALQNPEIYTDLDHLIACCARPTVRERLHSLQQRSYERSQAAVAAVSGAFNTTFQRSVSRGRDPRLPSSAAADATPAGPEVDTHHQLRQEFETMSETKPAPNPPPPPPPPPGREERGETPAFRPPPPPPPERK